jgi:multiple sugar transport system substrate-binding protein
MGAAATSYPLRAPAQVGRAKPFDGTTLNVAFYSAPYPKWLAEYVPDFEQSTGIKVSYETSAFPVYNQRMDLELSTKGSSYDVLNITFIYTSRWIGAGWFTPLDEFIKDPNRTPPDWDPSDFPPSALTPLTDKNGVLSGFPWPADAYMAAAGRDDLI